MFCSLLNKIRTTIPLLRAMKSNIHHQSWESLFQTLVIIEHFTFYSALPPAMVVHPSSCLLFTCTLLSSHRQLLARVESVHDSTHSTLECIWAAMDSAKTRSSSRRQSSCSTGQR